MFSGSHPSHLVHLQTSQPQNKVEELILETCRLGGLDYGLLAKRYKPTLV